MKSVIIKLNKMSLKKNKKPVIPFIECNEEYNLIDYALLIKAEYECACKHKIQTIIKFFENEINTKYKINEVINPGYETQKYIMYMYKIINEHSVNEFSRVIFPINNYTERLEGILKDMPEMMFLKIFADIKSKM